MSILKKYGIREDYFERDIVENKKDKVLEKIISKGIKNKIGNLSVCEQIKWIEEQAGKDGYIFVNGKLIQIEEK